MASDLPDYVASAKPVPLSKRIAWYASTAPTYAGIMLWFVFWQNVPLGNGEPGGTLSQGLGLALLGLVLAALLCHFFYYLVPGLLGMKTGLPLYIVGTSTYGVTGGFLMPGFLMGLLQFGWLGVNAFFSAQLLAAPFFGGDLKLAEGTPLHFGIGIAFAIAAAFMGLKGIQYVARVATFLPLIPFVILILLFLISVGGLGSFEPGKSVEAGKTAMKEAAEVAAKEAAEKEAAAKEATEKEAAAKEAAAKEAADKKTAAEKAAAKEPQSRWGVIAVLLTTIIGFFATAGAAGVDFGMNNRNSRDVQLGGLIGIAGAIILAGGLSLLIVAGTHGLGKGLAINDTPALMKDLEGPLGTGAATVFWYLLAIAAFPAGCFSAFIAANSFKTTLPKVNPFISVGLGTGVSIILVITKTAGNAAAVFTVIGASFGPVCGAMAADYLLAGRRWAGPPPVSTRQVGSLGSSALSSAGSISLPTRCRHWPHNISLSPFRLFRP